MSKFALIKIQEIEGKIFFYKLLINHKCSFDLFWSNCKLEGNLNAELNQIQARLQQVAYLKQLPGQKFKDITPKNERVKEYEIKTKHLRVYLFHLKEMGKVIVLGGKKTSQKSDIAHFRKIKKEYLKTI